MLLDEIRVTPFDSVSNDDMIRSDIYMYKPTTPPTADRRRIWRQCNSDLHSATEAQQEEPQQGARQASDTVQGEHNHDNCTIVKGMILFKSVILKEDLLSSDSSRMEIVEDK